MLSERRGQLEECDICSRFGARKSLLLTAATPLPKYDYTLLSDLHREPESITPKSKCNMPGIQKHVTVLNARNGDILRSGNIKGGMFWCLHINTLEDVSTRDVHIYLEHNFWDNSMKFHILMWYIKLIIQSYYFGFLFLVMLSVLTN